MVSCGTRLISDEPSTVDDFGAHERVATALAHLVTEEEGGRAIALEGSWGSGKTTAWQAGLTVGVLVTAAGLLGLGLWLRNEEPADIDTGTTPDDAVAA